MTSNTSVPPKKLIEMRKDLYIWFKKNGRHELPWRKTENSYQILISEIMLQQTQVERVKPHWENWITRWPNIKSLASAPLNEVINAWSGLGYNRRSVNLHRTAQHIEAQYDSKVPIDEKNLLELPGIGPYTAAAIRCFSANKKAYPADTNITRVIARAFFGLQNSSPDTRKIIQKQLEEIEPSRNFRKHYLALMDLGALLCQSRSPSCDLCPWQNNCHWLERGKPSLQTSKKKSQPFESTTRYARGQIVEHLRTNPTRTTSEIRRLLPSNHKKNTAIYLETLTKEGLIEKNKTGWSLPS